MNQHVKERRELTLRQVVRLEERLNDLYKNGFTQAAVVVRNPQTNKEEVLDISSL